MKKFLVLIFVSLIISSCSNNADKVIIGEVDADEIDIALKVPGRISSLSIKEGDKVKKGQILGKIESKELLAKLRTASAGLRAAQSQFWLAQKTFNRVSQIYQEGVISKQSYDEALYQLNASRQKVAASRGGYDEVRAYLSELTIKSPIDGEIVSIVLKLGELAPQGYPVITILNPSSYHAVFNIREDYLKDIHIGDSFIVFFPALNLSYQMEVYYISPLGSFASWKPTAQTGNYDLKTFEVRLRGAKRIADLRAGMTAILKNTAAQTKTQDLESKNTDASDK
jgi:HlyD family secretion protein